MEGTNIGICSGGLPGTPCNQDNDECLPIEGRDGPVKVCEPISPPQGQPYCMSGSENGNMMPTKATVCPNGQDSECLDDYDGPYKLCVNNLCERPPRNPYWGLENNTSTCEDNSECNPGMYCCRYSTKCMRTNTTGTSQERIPCTVGTCLSDDQSGRDQCHAKSY